MALFQQLHHPRHHPRADISIFLARNQSGIYVRAGRGEGPEEIAALLEPHRAGLEQSLGAALGPYGRGDYFLLQTYPKGHEETEAWGEIIDWMTMQIDRYRSGLIPLFQPGTFAGLGVPPAEGP